MSLATMSIKVVKIKSINASHKTKKFIVKGRIKPLPIIQNNSNGTGKHLEAILFDGTSSIQLVAFDNDCDEIWPQLEALRLISIENVEVREIKKSYRITNHKYNLILRSNKVKIKNLNDIDHSIKDYPKYPMFSKDLTTLRPETVVDVFGVFTEIGDVDETRTFRPGKFKVESSEINVKFFGEKIDKVYDVNLPSIIYSTKLKFYQGHFCLNVLNSSHVECNPNSLELNMQPQISRVTRYEQTVTENFVQPAVLSNDNNVIQGRRQNNGNKTVAKASKSETMPVLQNTADEIFVRELLNHINGLTEADKMKIRLDIIDLAINYKRDHNIN